MGLLRSSDCLKWSQIVKLKEELKKRGIKQFIHVYKNANSTFKHEFIWGDEIEIMACVDQKGDNAMNNDDKRKPCMIDSDDKRNTLTICEESNTLSCGTNKEINGIGSGKEKTNDKSNEEIKNTDNSTNQIKKEIEQQKKIMSTDETKEKDNKLKDNNYKLLLCSEDVVSNFTSDSMNLTVEFASYMIESTPAQPHKSNLADLQKIESCMLSRINCVKQELEKRVKNAFPLLMTCYPKLGRYDSFYNLDDQFGSRAKDLLYEVTRSMYFPDNAITDHKRFFSFVRNIINRRGRKVEGYIKIMDSACDSTVKSSDKTSSIIDRKVYADKKILDDKQKQDNNASPHAENMAKVQSNNVAREEGQEETFEDPRFEEMLKSDTKVLPGHIRVDSMGQGMGCCCLQLTLQASEIAEARMLYDMLGSLCPLFLRLTRATPLSQGKLLDTETRWDMLVFSVDCRTNEERGYEYKISGEPDKTGNDKILISKSRYSSIDMFISTDERNLKCYNDLKVPIHEEGYRTLIKKGVDEKMAKHVASLFIRDPILVYNNDDHTKAANEKSAQIVEDKLTAQKAASEKSAQKKVASEMNAQIVEDNLGGSASTTTGDKSTTTTEPGSSQSSEVFYTDDFENIQSSNWRSMRFKLPSQNVHMKESGWKVEVRPMEIQPTAHENSAYCIFIVLLSKAIIKYKLNFYIPISLVDENFRRANLCYNNESDYKNEKTNNLIASDVINKEESVKKSCVDKKIPKDKAIFYYRENVYDDGNAIVKEGTIEEIFLGNEIYEGIFNIVKKYVKESDNEKSMEKYLNFIEKRLKGDFLSVSDFIRKFVINHRQYKNDANASEEILNDLIDKIKEVTEKNDCEYLKN